MIVKVQIPLASSEEAPPALLYNQDRSILVHIGITKPLLARMNGRAKAFFHAEVENNIVELGDSAPEQKW